MGCSNLCSVHLLFCEVS